ncbi:nickel pincer cofactor biosynthesis protein LarC [Synechococcus sp. RSCCF101]|uniref:nickel pincer cofactor biosynthesis protein LarC n=1 Tax=Synechococcus sp. RSCCF101 TaxID=2511069 RepID=UPI0012484A4D|nr:nickel pincer cofactor biosynthesis protein LarC [Synechococcus sp. RSCCF101]QEY32051.1 nickel pincer cofactor biosynthesis protein LarC [Synechococcus sp. RSCCF101]
MKRLVVDCPTGLAGDMLLAALLDLGVPRGVVEEPLRHLGLLDQLRLRVDEGRSGGLRGLRVTVTPLQSQPQERHWSELRGELERSPLQEPLRGKVLAVFALLAEAEAAVHGQAPEAVHFHELGALDTLVDVVGVCAALEHLACEELICACPPAGHGSVGTAHGRLPVPVPAVLELARRCGVPLAGSGDLPAGELLTPTGLALMAVHASRFGTSRGGWPEAVGVGLGHRVLDRPNLVRLWLEGQMSESQDGALPETVLVQECQLDDADGEAVAHLQACLRRAGALDVVCQPVQMKKGRSGVLVQALARPDRAAALRRIWFRESTTLGLREVVQQRWTLPRRERTVQTRLGPVRIKEAERPGGRTLKPEHDDLTALAEASGLPLAEVRRIALAACQPGTAEAEEALEEHP